MAEVLGTLSFLDTPDVNGVLILTETTGVGSVSGTANQIAITGTAPNFTVGLADNAILPGTGSLTLPTGTTAQRPGTPANGMLRYNSTFGNAEFYSQTTWRPVGQVVQVVTGTIAQNSSNLQIPFDATTPVSTEGFQLWTQSFTPLYANSLITIQSNQWVVVNSAADTVVTGAMFNGTTCIYAQMISWTTNTGDGNPSGVSYTVAAGSTAARTYSFRAGPATNVTVFYNRGVTATYGGIVTGQYTITEFAQ